MMPLLQTIATFIIASVLVAVLILVWAIIDVIVQGAMGAIRDNKQNKKDDAILAAAEEGRRDFDSTS